uniref:Uncharacterized protein n=1 Tax=Avena sativa TaxID=4498 RepID=A0ACD5UN68_AVESA
MENLFSLDVEIPNTGPFRTPSPSLHPQEDNGGVGGERIDVGGGVRSGGAVNRCLSEWCFQKFIDDSPLLDTPAASAVNLDANSGPYNNPEAEASRKRRGNVHWEQDTSVVEDIPTPPTPTTATAMLDPMAYNTMLRRKLDADLAAVAMWRAQTSHGIPQQGSHGNRSSRNSNASNNVGSPNHIGDVGVHQLSSSYWDPSSSEDDMEGNAETTGNMNVTAAKVKKRKESNRDSARRSRSRKAAHMKELEEQVKMSEETMKRLTIASNFPQATPLSGSRLNTISNTLFPTQDTSVSYFYTTKTDDDVNNRYIHELAPITTFQIFNPSTSLCIQPMVTLDHHQIRTRGGIPSTSVPKTQWEATITDQNEFVNMGMQ